MLLIPDLRSRINQLRDAIGRLVYFYHQIGVSGCYACSLDPTTNLSTDSFCPVCSGLYWIPLYSTTEIVAHVTWGKKAFEEEFIPEGKDYKGLVRVQIEYLPETREMVEKTKFLFVDDVKTQIFGYDFRGFPEPNRIVIFGEVVDR